MATRTPNNLVAFPSVASSLHALPRATSMANVNLHPNLYASRANESEAKLQKALAKTASAPKPDYSLPPLSQSPGSTSSGVLMMRKPTNGNQKPKTQ